MIDEGYRVIAIQEKRPARKRTWVVVCLIAERAAGGVFRWARETKLLGGLEISFANREQAEASARRISRNTGVPEHLKATEGALCKD